MLISAVQRNHFILQVAIIINGVVFNCINVYNPKLKDVHNTLRDLEPMLHWIIGNVIITGDFNIHLFDKSSLRDYYVDLVESYGLHILNTKIPTRINSLIDHWITNVSPVPPVSIIL